MKISKKVSDNALDQVEIDGKITSRGENQKNIFKNSCSK